MINHIKISFKSILLVLTLGTPQLVNAQECGQCLVIARQKYENGHLEDIPSQLTRCILTKSLQGIDYNNALSLLVESYVALNQPDSALKYMVLQLNSTPLYEISENNPDIQFLYDQITVKPIGYISLGAGGNFSFPLYPVSQPFAGIEEDKLQYAIRPGYQIYGGLGIRIFQGLEMRARGEFSSGTWDITIEPQNFNSSQSINQTFDFLRLEYQERKNSIGGSLDLVYKWIPYPDDYRKTKSKASEYSPFIPDYAEVGIGITASYQVNNIILNPTRRTISEAGENLKPNIEGTTLNIADLRTSLLFGNSFSVGSGYQIGNSFLGIRATYTAFTTQANDPTTRYEADISEELLFRYGIVDKNLFIRDIMVSVEYIRPIYFHRVKKYKHD